MGIEPMTKTWQALMLPLHYIRIFGAIDEGRSRSVSAGDTRTESLEDSYAAITLQSHCDKRKVVTGVRVALTDVKGMNLPSRSCSIPACG
jgi:hypothetical protein